MAVFLILSSDIILIYFIDISTTNFYLLHAFRFIDQDTLTYSSSSTPLKLKSQPKAVAHEDDLTAVVMSTLSNNVNTNERIDEY